MPQTKNSKSKHGSALLITTILLFVIISMVVSLTYVTVMEQKMSQKTKSSVGAFYSSESGIEWALNKIANNSGTINSALAGLTTYDDGKIDCPFSGVPCSVYFLDSSGIIIRKADFGKYISEVKAVRSVGTQGQETQRAIEAAVAAGLPSGMIAMFDTACPTDWTRFTALDSKLPRGASSYSASGGNYTVTTGASTIPYVDVVWCKKN